MLFHITHLPLEACRVEAGAAAGGVGGIKEDVESGEQIQTAVDIVCEAIVEDGGTVGAGGVISRQCICWISDEGHKVEEALKRLRDGREEGRR